MNADAPTELRVSKDRKLLTISFGSGERYELSAEMLRVLSPSAEVRGHSLEQRVTVAGKANVEIMALHPTGNYAVRIAFDDMHDTGIFSWGYFRDLGRNREERWLEYLDELDKKGLSRTD